MAEENQPVTEQVVEKPALTEREQLAQAQGWVPKEEWTGDPEDWRPAKEFLDRGKLFEKIDEQRHVIKEMRNAMHEFSKHHNQMRKVEYERALSALKAQKKEALELGEVDDIIEIDEKIAAVRQEQQHAANHQVRVPEVPEIDPVFQNWLDRNSWYQSNEAMKVYADRIGNKLGAAGTMSKTDLLREVEKEVKKEFAHKFTNPKRDEPGAVESGSNKSTTKRDTFELTEEERRIMNTFVRQGIITKEKYMEDLKAKRGV